MTQLAVFHIPHSSTVIPEEIREDILLSEDELQLEILKMTDWFTDELFDLSSARCISIRYPISRLVLDPERFLDDDREEMSSIGMGVVYTRASDGRPLRRKPSLEERARLVGKFYTPHHNRLTAAASSILKEAGQVLVVDCHSFPSLPLPYEKNQDTDRPDICLGTDPFHTPLWLKHLALSLFSEKGFSVKLNYPFAGSLVPNEYYQKDARVLSLMVEVRRDLYMCERSGTKNGGFEAVKEKLQGILLRLVAAVVLGCDEL